MQATWSLGSAGEHRLHTAGVTGSNPVATTMNFKDWKSSSPFVLPAFLSFSILFYDDIPAGVMDVCRTLLSIIE